MGRRRKSDSSRVASNLNKRGSRVSFIITKACVTDYAMHLSSD